jgi:nitrogen regulatory protein P-II 1
MQRIEAIIRLSELDEVKGALDEVGITGMTLSEVRGFGRTGGREVYRGSAYLIDFVAKVKIEIVVMDVQVESILDAIERGAKTGKIGDGKIFVTNVPEVVRIRTGEHGEHAL